MRKLAWGTLSFAASILVTHYVLPSAWRYTAVAVLLVLAVVGGVLTKEQIRTGVLLVCIFSAFGVVRYDIHQNVKLKPTNDVIDKTHEINGMVIAYPDEYDSYSRLTVYLQTEGLPETKVALYAYGGKSGELTPGDVITAKVKFSSATIVSGEKNDSYIAKGIYLRGYIKDELRVVGRWDKSFLFTPLYLSETIRTIIAAYTPNRTAELLSALVTGDKTELYEDVSIYNSLSKAGISHMVAVSGMHIAFLLGLVMMLMGRHRGWLFAIVAIALFCLMTGLSPSALRAFFMQSIYLMAPIFRREPDGITSVSFALFILLLVNPFSVASLSLQMSFLAMAGILLLTPRIFAWFRKKGECFSGKWARVYQVIIVSFSTSLGVTVCTAPLCVYRFAYLSLLSPLTNLLILWLIPYCFAGGFLLCLVSMVSESAAGMIGHLLTWAVEFIYLVADSISKLPFAAVYLPGRIFLCWFIFAYALLTITYVSKGEKLYRPLLPTILVVGSLLLSSVGVSMYYRGGTTIGAVDVGQGQCIVLLDGDKTVMIDCGGDYDSGDRAADWLYCHGRNKIDKLVLTHFDEDHVNGVIELLNVIPVQQLIYTRYGLSVEKNDLLTEIATNAMRNGTQLTEIDDTKVHRWGDTILNYYVSSHSSTNDGIIVLAQIGTFDLLVTGDATKKAERILIEEHGLPDGECLVVGHHGSDSSTGVKLLDTFRPEYAIVSCGYNTYGHPTDEVLDRLEDRNVIIYRTDRLGSIEIKVR